MDLIFFWCSKIFWMFFSPDLLLVILLVSSLFFLWKKAYKKALFLLNFVVLIVLTITFLPVGDWLLHPLETRFKPIHDLPEKVDGIIVLGGAEDSKGTVLWDQVELGPYAERFLAFMQLARKYPDAKHVFTGGSGNLTEQGFKGSDVARRLFKEQGFDISKMIFESNSKNTYENAAKSYGMIKPVPGEKWILITSASHMPRAMGCFRKTGWDVIPYSVDHFTHPQDGFRFTLNFVGNLKLFQFAVREWVGLTAYYITGKTSEFFPGPSSSERS